MNFSNLKFWLLVYVSDFPYWTEVDGCGSWAEVDGCGSWAKVDGCGSWTLFNLGWFPLRKFLSIRGVSQRKEQGS